MDLGFQKLIGDPALSMNDRMIGTANPSDIDQFQFRTRGPKTNGPAIIRYTFVHFSQKGSDLLRRNFNLHGDSSVESEAIKYSLSHETEVIKATSLGELGSAGVNTKFENRYGDARIFQFSLKVTRNLLIDVKGTNPDMYPLFAIYRTSGESISAAYPEWDKEGNFGLPRMSFTLKPGTYYLVMGTYNVDFDRDWENTPRGWDRRRFTTTDPGGDGPSEFIYYLNIAPSNYGKEFSTKATKKKQAPMNQFRKKYRAPGKTRIR